jgi:predicted RNA-binding protein with RPS1 domain
LMENPWDVLSAKVKTWDVIKAPVSRISQFWAFIDLEWGIQGLIHLSEISHGVVKDIRDFIKVWEEIEAKIINFEPKKKRIGLSLKALQEAPKETKPKAKKAKEDATETKPVEKKIKQTAESKENLDSIAEEARPTEAKVSE